MRDVNVTAQEACQRSIVLAADDVTKLRKQDVLRVCQDFWFAHGDLSELVAFVSENRPDLTEEIEACEREIKSEAS